MRFAMIRCPRTLLLALGGLVVPAGAQAAVSISITSPTLGPIYDVRSRIVVNYASDDPAHPLNLATLSIRVNSVELAPRFTVTPSSAEYMPTIEESFVGGQLTIVASVADDAGTPATVSQAYEVIPTLTGLVPNTAQVGDTIVVRASGLDPTPSHNKLLLSPGGSAEFTSVDRANEEGTITIPPGTTTGAVQLEVNGKRSREKPILTVPSFIPNCGMVRDLLAMADGTWLVSYWTGTLPEVGLSSTCPLAWTTTRGNRWRVVKVPPGGLLQQVLVSGPNSIGASNTRFGVRVALNKERTKVAVATQNMGQEPGVMGAAHIYYDDHPMSYLLNKWLYAIDFDAEGNLYGLTDERSAGGDAARVYRLSRESLATGGEVTPEQIVDIPVSVGPQDFLKALVVSCDGFAYVGLDEWLDAYPFVRPHIFKVDLAARAVVADVQLSAGESHEELAVSCHTNELWGARWLEIQESSKGDFWRADATGTGLGIPETIVPLGAVGWPFGVTVGPSGNLYFYTSRYSPSWGTAVLAKRAAVEVCSDVGTALPLCACPSGKVRGPNQTCGSGPLVVTNQTTRWKPQRAADPMEIHFTGPDDVDLSIPGVLEIRPPAPAPPITLTGLIGVVTSGCAAGNGQRCYRLIWPGPWTYEDGGVEKRLPPGNYPVVVRAMAGTTPPLREVASAPYDKVSLVEVKTLEFEALTGAPALDSNPGPCPQPPGSDPNCTIPPSGARMLAEARDPGPTQPIYDRVKVVATIEPPVPDPGSQGLVKVNFRPLDVDDPAPQGLIDNESELFDNRGVPPTGFLTDAAGNEVGGGAIVEVPATNGAAAETILRASLRQGDNYRVAASTSADWPTHLSVVTGSQTGEVVHAVDPTVTEKVQVSEMLTVWRTLNLELKKMDPTAAGVTQALIQHNGTWTNIKKGKVIHKPAGIQDADHPNKHDWVGAYLRPAVTDPNASEIEPALPDGKVVFFVDASKKDSASVEGSLQAFLTSANKEYYLRDDELTSVTSRQHDLTFITDLLTRAYIKVDTQHNPIPLVPWHDPLTPQLLNSMTRLPSNAAAWSVPAVLAFELDTGPTSVYEDEHDNKRPSGVKSSGVLGLACGGAGLCHLPGDEPIVASFMETIRDFAWTDRTSIKPTVPAEEIYGSDLAHEVLHSLGLWHNGGIMCSTRKNNATDPMRYKVTDQQLALLREVDRPHVVANQWVSCGAEPNCCPDPQ